MLNTFMFIIFPYICLAAMLIGIAGNILFAGLRISAPATGFFEKKKLFWGIVPWHYGIITVLTGHLIGLLFPEAVLHASSVKGVRTAFEVAALAGGFAAVFGGAVLLMRKLMENTLVSTAGGADYLAVALLCVQAVLGVSVALNHRWGISWYAADMAEYLRGIITLRPSAAYVTGIPAVLSAHIVCGFLIFAVLPYTRLMHLLYVPVTYLFRKPQIIKAYSKTGN